MEIHILDVTPELARQLLAQLAPYQRKIELRHVQALEADMRAGRWKPNGSPIRFDKNGNLCDGQHRLAACIRSGVTLREQVFIAELEEDAYGTIDTNARRRTALQIARQRNLLVPPTTSCIAAAGLERYDFDVVAYEQRSTPTERVDLWEALAEQLQQAVKKFETALRVHRIVHRGALAAALRCTRDDSRAYGFFVTAFSNDAMHATSQGRVLFNTLAKARTRLRDPLLELQIAWSCMRAFIAHTRCEQLSILRPPTEWPVDSRRLSTLSARLPVLRDTDRRESPATAERFEDWNSHDHHQQ